MKIGGPLGVCAGIIWGLFVVGGFAGVVVGLIVGTLAGLLLGLIGGMVWGSLASIKG